MWDLMMVFWTFTSVATVVLITGSNAVLWSLSPDNITECDGHDVSIPWSFTSSSNETVISITWFVETNGDRRTLIASLTEGEFFSPSRQHVQFVPNAGVRLQNVTVSDTGLYSVHVNIVDHAGHVTISNRSAVVQVAVSPVVSGGHFVARRRSAPVKDDVTRVWHVILECGQFTDRGQPSVRVEWRTPSGTVYTDVSYEDGYFLLPLQAVELGNYTCSISYQSLARRCLASESMLLGEATVYVDENVKWTVMEANQEELIAEGQILRQEDQELKSQVQNLTKNQQILRQENMELKFQVQNCTDNHQILRQENQELKSQVQNFTHNQQILRQENQELKSQVQNLTQRGQLEKGTCVEVRTRGHMSGVYTLYQGNPTITVYCDQDTDGGGWTVFQRRQNGSVNFFRNWTDYRNGFGDLNREFWLGLDNLYILTSFRRYELRVDLEMFNGTQAFARYRGFRIGDVDTNYTLYFDDFVGGSAGDSLTLHRGHRFVTQDRDNSMECARGYHGAWWYAGCYDSSLNGIYRPDGQAPNRDGIAWATLAGTHVSMKRAEMKIRAV